MLLLFYIFYHLFSLLSCMSEQHEIHFELFAENCIRMCFLVIQLDPRIIRPFIAECRQTIAKLDNQNMKAIKGLEDRLYALDQMIASCGRLVNEQKELAQVPILDFSQEKEFIVFLYTCFICSINLVCTIFSLFP